MKEKKKRAKKKLPNKRKKRRPKKVVRRIGVFVPIQANMKAQEAKLDKYIVEQGCQRLGPFYRALDENKGIIELYARVRYLSKKKAKKSKPITDNSLTAELIRMAEQAKAKLIFPQT